MKRSLLIALAALLTGAFALAAQEAKKEAPPAGVSAEAKQAYNSIRNNLIKMADKMSEENYAFKPVPEIRSFGELMAHVAGANARFCGIAKGQPPAAPGTAPKTKAEITAALKAAFDTCDSAYESLTDASAVEMLTMGRNQRSRIGILTGNLAHNNEEYGYGAIYLRLKGVVPPSSER
jgi:hypothetical protein